VLPPSALFTVDSFPLYESRISYNLYEMNDYKVQSSTIQFLFPDKCFKITKRLLENRKIWILL
jgi:hypothetical protein